MNTLLNHRRDEDIDEQDELRGNRDREITLGTSMVLAIFFALAVLCAAFFGFGYSTGRHSAMTSAGAAGTAGGSLSATAPKPGAGSLFGSTIAPAPIKAADPVQTVPPPAPRIAPPAQKVTVADAPDAPAEIARPAADTPRVPKATPVSLAPTPATVAPGPGTFMVQVAAVSHPEDADLLLTTLKRRNYQVAVHSEPQDKLLHVQIGPFATKKDADLMRQRLLGDGFNAIVK